MAREILVGPAVRHPTCLHLPAHRKQPGCNGAADCTAHTHPRFAVKSGGHAAFAGASSVSDGLTIDLKEINNITVTPDNKTAEIGTGNKWIDVYDYLSPKGLVTVGGRVESIGVGGLTLGGMYKLATWNGNMQKTLTWIFLLGGISFYTGRYGFACDNVHNYEVCTVFQVFNLDTVNLKYYLATS